VLELGLAVAPVVEIAPGVPDRVDDLALLVPADRDPAVRVELDRDDAVVALIAVLVGDRTVSNGML